MPLLNLFIYLVSFGLIWFGAGLIISAVDKYTKRVKISSFAFSFFILGLLTSIPEISVGLVAVSERKGDIFVGNLLGGILVIFLFIIPILAILGNGIKITNQLDGKNLAASLLVMVIPAFMILDKRVTNFEGALAIISYLILFVLIEKRKGLMENLEEIIDDFHPNKALFSDFLKLVVGVIIVFTTSHLIIDKTFYFADFFKISPFVISLIALSIGTNLPELTLAVKSVLNKKKDIAFGDYMGSAAANTLLFGVFTIMYKGEVLTGDGFFLTFVFTILMVVLVYIFAKTESTISRLEGAALLGLFGIFTFVQIF